MLYDDFPGEPILFHHSELLYGQYAYCNVFCPRFWFQYKSHGTDVNSIMRDMMSIILEGALDQELDEELGYSKYDYRNKETDNSRNGYSQKTLHTSYGDIR